MLKRQDDEDDDEVEIEDTNFENNSSFRPISNPLITPMRNYLKIKRNYTKKQINIFFEDHITQVITVMTKKIFVKFCSCVLKEDNELKQLR